MQNPPRKYQKCRESLERIKDRRFVQEEEVEVEKEMIVHEILSL